MNDLTRLDQSGALATPSNNAFLSYSEAAAGNSIVGDLLKFSKGDYTYGRDGRDMRVGTRLIANVADLKVGHVRWQDGRPVDTVMGRLAGGFVPASRSSLGDTDQSLWEVDPVSGQPRDPWQPTNTLLFRSEKSEQLYTFSTSSKGGISAIGKLCGEYGKRMRSHPNEIPVVALEVDAYNHPNRALGRIKVPKFNVVAWVDKGVFDEALAANQAAAEEDDLPF